MNAWILEHLGWVSLGAIFAAPLLVIAVLRLFHRYYPHEPTKSVVAAVVANLIIACPFTVWLNNEFALKRDRDDRQRALRQQHLARLKSIFRIDAEKLERVAAGLSAGGYVMNVDADASSIRAEQDQFWVYDRLDSDLCAHFKTYCDKKQSLRKEVELQDQKFRETLALIEGQIKSQLSSGMKREVARSVMQRCLDKGQGVTLVLHKGGGLSYSSGTRTVSVGGRPSKADLAPYLALLRTYKAFKPDAEIISRCRALREHGDAITLEARALAAEASSLTEQTNLNGECAFLRVD